MALTAQEETDIRALLVNKATIDALVNNATEIAALVVIEADLTSIASNKDNLQTLWQDLAARTAADAAAVTKAANVAAAMSALAGERDRLRADYATQFPTLVAEPPANETIQQKAIRRAAAEALMAGTTHQTWVSAAQASMVTFRTAVDTARSS